MARDPSAYDRQARAMDEIAQACGHDANHAHYARTARELRRKAHELAAGATFQLGRPIVRGLYWRSWWVVLLRAVAAVVFGLLTLAWPRHSALALVTLFGVYALFDGLTVLLISASARRPRLWLTLGGAVSVVAGLLAFARPRLLALMLVGVVGGWLVLRGVSELIRPSTRGDAEAAAEAVERRHWTVILSGAMTLLFGAGLLADPKIGGLALMWAIGAWAVMHGFLLAGFALSLRRHGGPVAAASPGPEAAG
jgi:uncharacterized membrane protein HdeD (DUF308 family)